LISLASLLPWSSWPFGLAYRAIARARKAGFQGLQAVPFRGIWWATKWLLPVLYKEHAWNAVWTFLQVLPVLKNLRFMWGDAGMPATPKDWVLFPSPPACRATERRLPGETIDHGFRPGATLVELCPELDMTPEEIAEICHRRGIKLALDTQHLTRGFRVNDPRHNKPSPLANETNWRHALDVLAPHIKVLHVKAIDGLDREMVLYFLSVAPAGLYDLVAEFQPNMESMRHQLRYLQNFLTGLKELVAEACAA